MPPRTTGNIIVFLLIAVLTLMGGCSKHERNEELAVRLADEIVDEGFSSVEHALQRVDSAAEAGVFTAAYATTTKARIYANADQRRMAAYYAEKVIAAETGHPITTPTDSDFYCTARWILADGAYANGEYGKSLALAKEILAFVGDGASPSPNLNYS